MKRAQNDGLSGSKFKVSRRAFVLAGLGLMVARPAWADESLEPVVEEDAFNEPATGLDAATPVSESAASAPDAESATALAPESSPELVAASEAPSASSPVDTLGASSPNAVVAPSPEAALDAASAADPAAATDPAPNPDPDQTPWPVEDGFAAQSIRVHFIVPTCARRTVDSIVLELISAAGEKRFILIDGGFGPTTGANVAGYSNRLPITYVNVLSSWRESYNHAKRYIDSLGVAPGNLLFYLGTHPHKDHMGCAAELISAYRPQAVFTPEYSDSFLRPNTDMYLNISGALVTGSNLGENQRYYDRCVAAAQEVGARLVTSIASWDEATFSYGGVKFTIVNWDTDYRERTGDNRMKDPNTFSWGLLVEGCGRRIFLGADIDNNYGSETRLASWIGKVDLFKLNHHGCWDGNSAALLSALSPTVAYATASNTNETDNGDYPTWYLLSMLRDLGTRLFTAEDAYASGMDAFVVTLNNGGIKTGFDGALQRRKTPAGNLLYNDGKLAGTGWLKSGGRWYYTDDGVYLRGWQKVDDEDYYFNDDGALKTGWVKGGGNWYYMQESGYWLKGCVKWVGGALYGFGADGAMLVGWNQVGSYWYCFRSSGAAYVGGTYYPDGATAVFDGNGHLTQGWVKGGSYWYFMKKNGRWAKNEWVRAFDGKYYYFNGSGRCTKVYKG